ncbi:M20/M25/M40 family metallo-hydrolase [Streptomyces sp. NPDC003863]
MNPRAVDFLSPRSADRGRGVQDAVAADRADGAIVEPVLARRRTEAMIRWSFHPAFGQERDGWLLGRGAADWKPAAAMFCHIAADLALRAHEFAGGLAVLVDVDEHTGTSAVPAPTSPIPGRAPGRGDHRLPGIGEVVGGGRGLWRATIAVHAPSGHSGSSRSLTGTVTRGARLVHLLDTAEPPRPRCRLRLPVGTEADRHGHPRWRGLLRSPDRVDINVDVRTTPPLDASAAEAFVRKAAAELPVPIPAEAAEVAAWPAFRVEESEQSAAALLPAARETGLAVRAKTAGPSSIDNLLAGHRIPATAGFGVPYEDLHGIDERASLVELPTVYAIHERAVLGLPGLRWPLPGLQGRAWGSGALTGKVRRGEYAEPACVGGRGRV